MTLAIATERPVIEEIETEPHVFYAYGYRKGWCDAADALYKVGPEFRSIALRLKEWTQTTRFAIDSLDLARVEAGRLMAQQAKRMKV